MSKVAPTADEQKSSALPSDVDLQKIQKSERVGNPIADVSKPFHFVNEDNQIKSIRFGLNPKLGQSALIVTSIEWINNEIQIMNDAIEAVFTAEFATRMHTFIHLFSLFFAHYHYR